VLGILTENRRLTASGLRTIALVKAAGAVARPAMRAVAVTIAVLVALLIVELALHIYNPLPFRVRGERIILPVHQRYTFHNDGASKLDPVTHHTKNALGFRGPDPPRDFEKHLTILTIGGSTTECLFLSDGKTWTDAVARRLAIGFPGIWVNNAGLDGQSTYGHLILLRDFVVALHPTVAIFLVGANDVGLDAGNPYDNALVPGRTPWRTARTFLVEHSEIAQLAQNLARMARAKEAGFGHSQIDLTKLVLLEDEPDLGAATIRTLEPPLHGFGDRLTAIAELCRRNGIDPVFITQPGLFGDALDPVTGVNLARIQVRGTANGKIWWRVQEMYNDVTRRVAADRQILLIDAARELPKDSRLFYDLVHFTNEGAVRLGELVAAHLEPHLRGLVH
jgi:lysophospholipase L1-like esterase